MRKSHKKALGLLGLATVVGMTTVAANLPTPAGAVSSVTDVISVTVVDNVTPAATIAGITDGTIFTNPAVNFSVEYTNLKSLTVKLRTPDGSTIELFDGDLSYADRTDTKQFAINLDTYNGGYGSYSIFVEGDGYVAGATPGDSVNFRYNSVNIEGIGTETDLNGNYINNDIDTDDITGNPIIQPETSTEVEKVVIEVRDKDNNKVIEVTGNGQNPVDLPFEENGLPTGDYKITIIGKDGDGNIVGDPITIIYHYEAPEDGNQLKKDENGNPIVPTPSSEDGHYVTIAVYGKEDDSLAFPIIKTDKGDEVTLPFVENNVGTGVYTIVVTEYDARDNIVKITRYTYYYVPNPPKTGSFLGSLNISRADYLTTGAIVFGTALIFAFVFLRKKKGTRRR